MDPLPPELLPLIASYLDDKDLQSFALTCRCINEVARKQMTWKVRGLKQSEAFLHLLLVSKDVGTSEESLVPSLIHRLEAQAFSVEDEDKKSTEEIDECTGNLCSILDLCGNLRCVRFAARHFPPGDLQDKLATSLGSLSSLKDLNLFETIIRFSAFNLFVSQTRARLDSCSAFVDFQDADSTHVCAFPYPLHKQTFLFLSIDNAAFSSFAHRNFPRSRKLSLFVFGLVDPSLLAEALALSEELAYARVVCFVGGSLPDESVRPPPLRVNGRSAVFTVHLQKISDLGTVSLGTTNIAPWPDQRAHLEHSLEKGAIGDVWVRKGNDMGREEQAEVMEIAQTYDKKVE